MKKYLAFGLLVGIFAFSGSALAADGAKIYASKCFACHGQNGSGTPMAPALKGNDFIMKGDVALIKKVILEGRSGKDRKFPKLPADMPKVPMPDEELTALIQFIKGDMQK